MTDDKRAIHMDVAIGRGGIWGRREFVKSMAALAGSAGLIGYDMNLAAAEAPPETKKIRLGLRRFHHDGVLLHRRGRARLTKRGSR